MFPIPRHCPASPDAMIKGTSFCWDEIADRSVFRDNFDVYARTPRQIESPGYAANKSRSSFSNIDTSSSAFSNRWP